MSRSIMFHLLKPAAAVIVIPLATLLVACSSDPAPGDDVGEDASTDISDDAVADAELDSGEDVEGDADTTDDVDASDDPDAGDDAESDADTSDVDEDTQDVADEDTEPAIDWEDGYDAFAPWMPPTADWSDCADTPNTRESLAAKAAYYDWIVPRLHQFRTDVEGHEDYSRVFHPVCETNVPTDIVDDSELPVCYFEYNENNGLWTSLYIASQAFRYAVTEDPVVLEQLRRTVRGQHNMLRITGTPGLFTRDFHDPDTSQQECPADPMEYVMPGEDRIGNRWVRVGDDGCFITYDPELNDGAGDWVNHADWCTDVEFAGFCWQMNMSKDEMAGQMFAAGVVAKLIDDEEILGMASDMLQQVGHHLIDNDFWITDFNGTDTRFGSVHAMSFDHLPGYNAFLSLSWMRSAASVTGDTELVDFYNECLLQSEGRVECIDRGFEQPRDYRSHLGDLAIQLGCDTNYDNVGIMSLMYPNLMWFEPNPNNVELFRTVFEAETRGPDGDGRDVWTQENPHLNFILAAMMGDEPDNLADAEALVHDGVCALREFRATNVRQAVDGLATEVACTSDRHGELAADILPLAERCVSMFEWWGDPAEIESCPDEPTRAAPPADFLLPYWMGRYFGFIDAED